MSYGRYFDKASNKALLSIESGNLGRPMDFDDQHGLFWLQSSDVQEVFSYVKEIRSSPEYTLTPIFTLYPNKANEIGLSDGVFNLKTEVVTASLGIFERIDSLPPMTSNAVVGEERLLRYFYTRPNVNLMPKINLGSEAVYNYPLLECFIDDQTEPKAWLQSLVNDEYLAVEGLLDRTRHCVKCDSAQLNYLDICPNCSDLEIETKKFIHCFTCGNVAPQESFMQRGRMQCHVCETHLKHIGSDYDRPLESMGCTACSARFDEPEVVARCFSCNTVNDTSELTINEVASYKLTDYGKLCALQKELKSNSLFKPQGLFMKPELFCYQLDWQINAARSLPNSGFYLVKLAIENSAQLDKVLSPQKASKLIDYFFTLLVQLVKVTDMAFRESRQILWICQPLATKTTYQQFSKEIERLVNLTHQNGGASLKLDVTCVIAPDQLKPSDDSQTLLNV